MKKIYRNLLSKLSQSTKHSGQYFYLNKNYEIMEISDAGVIALSKDEGEHKVEIHHGFESYNCNCSDFKQFYECAHIATILIHLINQRVLPSTKVKKTDSTKWKELIDQRLKERDSLKQMEESYQYKFYLHLVGDLIFIEFKKLFIKQTGELGREMKPSKEDCFSEYCKNSIEEKKFLQTLFYYAYQIDHFSYPKNKIRLKAIELSNSLINQFKVINIEYLNSSIKIFPERVHVQLKRENDSYQYQISPENGPSFYPTKLIPIAEFPLAFFDGQWIYETSMMNAAK